MDRSRRAALAAETLEIIRAGGYPGRDRAWVDIAPAVEAAVRGTVSYPPAVGVPAGVPSAAATTVSVTGDTTIAAARRLAGTGLRTGALNFASARHPGGGFRTGAQAQEESLARASALFPCLAGNPMYAHHDRHRDPFYSDHVVFSPDVPFFRDDSGALLDPPFLCSVVTSPAVNAGVVRRRHPDRVADIESTMRQRIRRILDVAAHHGVEALVLGAWGCGVFGNSPELIARLFADDLSSAHQHAFRVVTFAVYDATPDQRVAAPFRAALAHD